VAPHTEIEDEVTLAAPTVDLSPDKIEFGRIFVPLWLKATYQGDRWSQARIERLSTFELHPAALVFHYGQSVFEGLKAYHCEDGSVNLFRPYDNAARFARSAERMVMPAIEPREFVEGIRSLVDRERAWIPKAPGSLYIRPIMIATEACLGVRGGHEFLYYVITLPSGAYFPQLSGKQGTGAVRVYVTTSVGRAAHGGTGNVKASANYAVTLKVIGDGKAKGCPQVLFLDSSGQHKVEEMGGMNVFFVRQGKLVTPTLHDTILPGVTRDSVLQLAARLGYSVEEQDIVLEDLLAEIKSGVVTEAFACGTAAVVVGIESLLIDTGEEIQIADGGSGPLTTEIYTHLTDIQYGRSPDPFEWIVKV
jgi:branched-chain amino acid aminotransferase